MLEKTISLYAAITYRRSPANAATPAEILADGAALMATDKFLAQDPVKPVQSPDRVPSDAALNNDNPAALPVDQPNIEIPSETSVTTDDLAEARTIANRKNAQLDRSNDTCRTRGLF